MQVLLPNMFVPCLGLGEGSGWGRLRNYPCGITRQPCLERVPPFGLWAAGGESQPQSHPVGLLLKAFVILGV